MAKETTKKMTLKEFKQFFNEVYDFEIWGYEGILNMLACLESREEEEYIQRGSCLAKPAFERWKKIHDELEKRGYYNR